ncbi:hypothetical protein ACLBKU_02505 [Erythrobacter sp. NE805]|uniref:hypothetical protein n=1 Tax=Erythrobacter sp. NE805 TaxID=3389875 RepID=UPI00396B4264
MLYPNSLQAVLLFDRALPDLDAMMRDFTRIEAMRSGTTFSPNETIPGRLHRLFVPGEELNVSFELMNGPPKMQVLAPALGSAYIGIVTPDIRQRVARAASHVIIEVSHGVLAGVEAIPGVAKMMGELGMARAGATRAEFERRLGVLALAARVAIDHTMPVAVHWTQSDQLVSGEAFDHLAGMEGVPGPLHIHPYLFGPRPAPGEEQLVGFRTFGARHWLGREIIVQPNVLPWDANLDTVFAFLRLATMPNGYVIPHGDTFGPEDRSLSYKVLHHAVGDDIGYQEPEPADVPFYELLPLKHLAHGFVAPAHVPEANAFDDRAFPVGLMPEDQDAKAALANEWAEKRRLAEGVGGRFEVRAAGPEGAAPPDPPSPPPAPVSAPTPSQPGMPGLSGRGLRARVFGRKGL